MDNQLDLSDFEANLGFIIFSNDIDYNTKKSEIIKILSKNCTAVKKDGWFEDFYVKVYYANRANMDDKYKKIIQNFISNNTASCTISGGRKSTKGTKRKTKGGKTKTKGGKTKGGKTKTRKNKKTKRRTGK